MLIAPAPTLRSTTVLFISMSVKFVAQLVGIVPECAHLTFLLVNFSAELYGFNVGVALFDAIKVFLDFLNLGV